MTDNNQFAADECVAWSWGRGEGVGLISERFERSVTRTLKGSKITRNGSADNPAYLIRQEDGAQVLKLGSELRAP